jgi:hypothetical protein
LEAQPQPHLDQTAARQNARKLILDAVLLVLGIAAFTGLQFRIFPGHTYLQSDTQIYLPILERMDEPGFLSRDPVATRPHVSFTIYDEVTLALRRVRHMDFETILTGQQLLFRGLGFLGVYLFFLAGGLARLEAFAASALFHLGGALLGPAVLLVEYEPVPRAFALPLTFLALGLFAQRRPFLASLAGTLAFLYHPPTAAPFWALLLVSYAFDRGVRIQTRATFVPLLVGGLLLANLAQPQLGVVEQQHLLGRLPDSLAAVQLIRTKYAWVSLWAGRDIWAYLAFWICAIWALVRLWPSVNRQWRWSVLMLSTLGILSVPVSLLLLEGMHLAFIPQLQPARWLVFTIGMCSAITLAAAIQSARQGRYWEAFGWFLPAFAIPIRIRAFDLFSLAQVNDLWPLAVWLALSGLAAFAFGPAASRFRAFALPALPLLATFLIPASGVVNYPKIDPKPVNQVAAWAAANTWGSSMFLFPDAGHDVAPGMFRARSQRALWVDWKSGGQANYFPSFGAEWWERWQQTMAGSFTVDRLRGMLDLPVDYYVLRREHRLAPVRPVFSNQVYVVYDARDLRKSSTSLREGTDD